MDRNVIINYFKAVGSNNSVKVSKVDWENLNVQVQTLTKQLSSNLANEQLQRPAIDALFRSSDTGAKYPVLPIDIRTLQILADDIDALRLAIEVLIREMFRNGFEVVPSFAYKCANKSCGKEYKTKPTDLKNTNT